MLSKEKIKEYQERLEAEKKKLLQEIASHNPSQDFGSDVDGFDEETDEAEEFGNQLSIIEALKVRVNEIDAALNKIEKGDYGVCEKCGGGISEPVLDVVPESLRCEHCKKGE